MIVCIITSSMKRKFLINYADITHFGAQARNAETGLKHGGFDEAICFNKSMVSKAFRDANKQIFSVRQGAGLWLWKPWIIYEALTKFVLEGEYVFYSDAGAEWMAPVDPLVPLCDENDGILHFHTEPGRGNTEIMQTKGDVFARMGAIRRTDEPLRISTPRHAGFQMYKACDKARHFVLRYLFWCCDYDLISDEKSVHPNYPGFVKHRHDQSIFSVLSKRYGMRSYREPTQWSANYIKEGETYGVLINHTRKFD